jgi:hypothetical protein
MYFFVLFFVSNFHFFTFFTFFSSSFLGGNSVGTGGLPSDTFPSSSCHSLYGGSNVLCGQMNDNGELSSFLFPTSLTSLTPNLSNLNLLCLGGDGTGVSPDDMGYFGSPRPDRGSGLTPGHSSGLTPGQFFLFGASGRTPSSAPFSAGVSDVDSGYRGRRGGGGGGCGSGSGLLSSGVKNGFRNRTDFYRTGLTPAATDSDSPAVLSNSNTPLSEIGDISISSSVFSPSFSPRSSYQYHTSNSNHSNTNNNINSNNNNINNNNNNNNINMGSINKDIITKSPRTEEALQLLADCIGVSEELNSNEKSNTNRYRERNVDRDRNIDISALPTPSFSPSSRSRNGNSNNGRNSVNYGSSINSVFLQNATLSATSVEKSFSLCQKYFPMVSTHIALTIYLRFYF